MNHSFTLQDRVQWNSYRGIIHSRQYGGFVILEDEESGNDITLFDKDCEDAILLSAEDPKNKFSPPDIVVYDGKPCKVMKVTWSEPFYIYRLMDNATNQIYRDIAEEKIA